MSFTVKELLNEAIKGKVIPTHLKNGKPNPNHPKYQEHLAAYVPPVKELKGAKKVNMLHLSQALQNIPDEDSSEAVHRIAKKLNITDDEAHKGLSREAGHDYHAVHADEIEQYHNRHGTHESNVDYAAIPKVKKQQWQQTVTHREIDLHHKRTGAYLGSTVHHKNKEEAIKAMERTYPRHLGMITAKFSRKRNESEEIDEENVRIV